MITPSTNRLNAARKEDFKMSFRYDFDLSLYLVLDPELCGGITGMVQTVKEGIHNGVTFVQLRSEKEMDKKYWYEAGIAIKRVIDQYNAELSARKGKESRITFVVNDHIDVALAIDADGAHVGQKDLPVHLVRQLLGEEKIVGLSVGNREELTAVDRTIVDYIGIGPAFTTSTKRDARQALSPAGVEKIIKVRDENVPIAQEGSWSLPAVGIGGVTAQNAESLLMAGVEGIAVVSAICGQPDPGASAKELAHIVQKAKDVK